MNTQPPTPSEEVSNNNARIFKLFLTNLDPKNPITFAEITTRFAEWLNDSKAYYAAGRRQILEVLLSIHKTLRSAVNFTPNLRVPFYAVNYLDNPMTLNYINVINVVSAYQQYFDEPEHRRALLWLLQSLEGMIGQLPTTMSRNQNNPTSSTQQHHPTSLQPPSPMMDSSSHLAHLNSAVEKPQSSNPQYDAVQRRQPMRAVPMSGQESLEIQRMLAQLSSPPTCTPNSARDSTNQVDGGESSTTDQAIFDSAPKEDSQRPETTEEQVPPQSGGSIISVGGKTKAKKKKKLDLSAFIQKDVEDFKGKLSQVKEASEKGPEVAKIDTSGDVTLNQDVSMSTAVDDQTALLNAQQDGPDLTWQTNSLHIPGESVPKPDTTIHHKDVMDTGMSGQPPLQISSRPDISSPIVPIVTSAQAEKEIPIQKMKPQDINNQQLEDEKQSIPLTSSPVQTISTNQHIVEVQDIQMQDNAPTSCGVTNPSTPNQNQNATLHTTPSLNSMQTGFSSVPQHPLLSTAAKIPDLNVMGATQTEPKQQPQEQTQTPRPFFIPDGSSLDMLRKWHEEYKAAAASEQPKEYNKQDREEEETRLRYEQHLADDVAALDEIENTNQQQPLNIVAVQEGLGTAFTVELAVDMKQDSLNRVIKWINNNDVPIRELYSSSKCLSLACYYTHDVERIRRENKTGSVSEFAKALFHQLTPAWPQNGGITMNVNYHGSRKTLPLAPPLLLTEDGLVDASVFLSNGGNLLQIHRQKQCTERTLLLFSHHPTRNQLRTIVEHRKKELEWRRWLAGITTPFQKPAAFR